MSLLELEDVTMSFGGLTAVDGASFAVHPGEVFALVGPNGAGKSTIFNLVSRYCTPGEGDIRFDGKSILGCAPHDIPRLGIARTFQNIELFERATVLQNLLIGKAYAPAVERDFRDPSPSRRTFRGTPPPACGGTGHRLS